MAVPFITVYNRTVNRAVNRTVDRTFIHNVNRTTKTSITCTVNRSVNRVPYRSVKTYLHFGGDVVDGPVVEVGAGDGVVRLHVRGSRYCQRKEPKMAGKEAGGEKEERPSLVS